MSKKKCKISFLPLAFISSLRFDAEVLERRKESEWVVQVISRASIFCISIRYSEIFTKIF